MWHEDWVMPFLSLDLRGATLVPICNDDEDMLEIRWSDGMWIDVGFIQEERTYYITTVADHTLESWNNPLAISKTTNREDLVKILQQEIFRCRKQDELGRFDKQKGRYLRKGVLRFLLKWLRKER